MSVLEELKGVVRAIERALDVAEHDVYPASAVGFGGLATAAGIDHGVGMIERNHGTEGAQTVTEDLGLRVQASLRPLGQGVQCEGGDRLDNRTPGTTGVVRFYRDHERPLVLRTAAGLAAVAFATQIRVIDLDEAGQLARCFAHRHRLHDVVLQALRRARMHAQMPRQFKSRDVSLGVSEHVQSEKPDRQRQAAVFKQRARSQTGLMPAGAALPQPFLGALESAVGRGRGARTDETARPACPQQRLLARRFRAVLLQERRQRQAGLELHAIRRHDPSLPQVNGDARCAPAVSIFATLAEIRRKSGLRLLDVKSMIVSLISVFDAGHHCDSSGAQGVRRDRQAD